MMKTDKPITKPEEVVVVYWTHPNGGADNAMIYHIDDLHKAIELYQMSVKMLNIPAWVMHEGHFLHYTETEKEAEKVIKNWERYEATKQCDTQHR